MHVKFNVMCKEALKQIQALVNYTNGINKSEDIKVSIENNTVEITGERNSLLTSCYQILLDYIKLVEEVGEAVVFLYETTKSNLKWFERQVTSDIPSVNYN